MRTNLDWGRLYSQGRCKAPGVPWTTEENLAVVSGIPAAYVRLGILTQADYEEKQAEEAKMKEVPLIHRDYQELLQMAHAAGIPATTDATKETLVGLLEQSALGSKVSKKSNKKGKK